MGTLPDSNCAISVPFHLVSAALSADEKPSLKEETPPTRRGVQGKLWACILSTFLFEAIWSYVIAS